MVCGVCGVVWCVVRGVVCGVDYTWCDYTWCVEGGVERSVTTWCVV